MATVNLTFVKTNAAIDLIRLDASLSELHQSEVEITEHPVETGTNIVDHARPKPDVLTIEGVVTNDPLPSGAEQSATQPTLAGQAYQDLLDLKDQSTLITVHTSLRNYDNMMIRSLHVPRDPRTGQALRFSATMIAVRIVSTKTVALAATPSKNLGKKATPPATPSQTKTVLKDLSDTTGATGFIGGLLGG